VGRKGSSKSEKKRTGKRKGKRKSQARRADRHALYEQSVQDPDYDLALAKRLFKKRFGRPPRLLREDFCGTAVFACRWVAGHPDNRAWGIDLDPKPLAWGREHHVKLLSQDQASRLELVQGDVMNATHERVDVTVAYNFSYLVFDSRKTLRAYFRKARSTLRDEGLFLLDLYGGPDSMRLMTETREHDGFDYVWDQDEFDPVSHHAVNHIHFEFPDGSRLNRAFSYRWRLWTLPELRELLEEAGFSQVDVYWEGTDAKTQEGNGVYRKVVRAPADPAWISYIAAAL